jgi:cytoskeletal protein CcmA (bactofilin family)
MNQTQRRRLLDRLGDSPTLVARGTHVAGDIQTAGALMVGGQVQGDARVGGELHISAAAQWDGDVYAHSAVIDGRVNGSVTVSERIEIGPTAVIYGRVSARMVAIARGARVEGEIASGAAVVEFEQKRKG